MYVAMLAAIDILLLTVVTAIPEARSVGKLVIDQEHPPFRDVSTTNLLIFSNHKMHGVFATCTVDSKGDLDYVAIYGPYLNSTVIVKLSAFYE